MNDIQTLSKLANVLIRGFGKTYEANEDEKISVNPFISEVASWYEKFRTAMDYREDEVILRSAIERILKRRLLLGGTGQSVAEPLIRELIWARYFPDSTVPETVVSLAAKRVDLYLKLQKLLEAQHNLPGNIITEWIFQLMSADIQDVLKPNDKKELMSNFIYQIFNNQITIADDEEETRDIQTFIAVRRAYGKEDLAFLRYHLFRQYFGKLTESNLEKVADHFLESYQKIEEQLNYPLKDRIYSYIKKQIVPFFILEDVLRANKGRIRELFLDSQKLDLAVLNACTQRYSGIMSKVRTAVIRSVIFIFFTKALFALAIEGTFENIIYGHILWGSMVINTLTPPLLMILVGSFIKTPGRDNSNRILQKIHTILFDEKPQLARSVVLKKNAKTDPWLMTLFIIMWVIAIGISFGAIIFVLSKLHFNVLSQGVFLFFLAVVSFLAYRINQTAHSYVVKDDKDKASDVLFDFFFMPFVQIGRNLTLGISQINIFLFILDFIIETPFKNIFAFFEQWFLYLRVQREKLD